MIDLFNHDFFFRGLGPGNHGRIHGIDELFRLLQLSKRKTLLVIDADCEDTVRGLFLMYGISVDIHAIQDSRVILFSDMGEYDRVIYPYDPLDHCANVDYTSLR
jgi:hypothetical protein